MTFSDGYGIKSEEPDPELALCRITVTINSNSGNKQQQRAKLHSEQKLDKTPEGKIKEVGKMCPSNILLLQRSRSLQTCSILSAFLSKLGEVACGKFHL